MTKLVKRTSATMEFKKAFEEGDDARDLLVYITLTAPTEKAVEGSMEGLQRTFLDLAKYNSYFIDFDNCNAPEELEAGKWQYTESFILPYEHGLMTEYKKELRAIFKRVKAEYDFK